MSYQGGNLKMNYNQNQNMQESYHSRINNNSHSVTPNSKNQNSFYK